MVALNLIQASNVQITTSLPAGLVALFIGGTNGVGETSVKQFAVHANAPRVYIIGRSQEAGERIARECREVNPGGSFMFLQKELHLMRNVELLCEEIKRKEKVVNLLFLSIGTLQYGKDTEEELHYPSALTLYARYQIISRLLPLLQRARHLRRVVTVFFGGGWERSIDFSDFQSRGQSRMRSQGQMAAITTFGLLYHQTQQQEGEGLGKVGFVHVFPGSVASGIARGEIGWFMRTLKTIAHVLASLVDIPFVEAGERFVFLCTSTRYADGGVDGTPLLEGLEVGKGVDGMESSGVFSVDEKGECAGPKLVNLVGEMKKGGELDRVGMMLGGGSMKAILLEL
ncbi:hypothetical protein LTR86_008015 [Recurvomyces mirabilis]|nr:hypothetical protein LTR86_008015 [Recurvomyces mirabilis]